MAEAIRIKGFKAAVRKMEAMARASGSETASGTRILAEATMTDVKASRPGAGVPVDEGTLRNSGKVEGPDSQKVVRITFGGAAAPHALAQHERTDFAHKLGEARYLIRGLERTVAGGKPTDALKGVADELIRIGKVTL